jgi:hypothetical protein
LTGKEKQFAVIIQAGMNHRASFDKADEDEVRSMLFNAKRNPAISEVFVNGVSIPDDMCSADADRLNSLNRFMEVELGSDHYIAPLNQVDVHVVNSGIHRIHYDQETVDCISRKIIRQVTGSDF